MDVNLSRGAAMGKHTGEPRSMSFHCASCCRPDEFLAMRHSCANIANILKLWLHMADRL